MPGKNVLVNLTNGLMEIDENSCVSFMDFFAESLTGVSRESALKRDFREVFEGLDLPEDVLVDASINGKSLLFCGYRVEGGRRIVMIQDNSEIIKMADVFESAKSVAEDMDTIFEGSFDGLLVTDGEGNVLMVNKSYERVTGLKKEEMIGRNMKNMLNPQYMKNSVILLAIEERQPVSLQHFTKHGRSIIVTGVPVFGADGAITKVVANARDISEIYELRQELIKSREMEKIYWRQLQGKDDFTRGDGIVIVSEVMRSTYALAGKLSNFNTTVMILGESGVGKEELAKYIHENSPRRKGPFITVNCGAIPETLLESELFGYNRGAFTGALDEGKQGLFEAAEDGTILLDEIAEMPLSLQVKLLRVLETGALTRIGATKPIPLNMRILTATNKNLVDEVNNRTFRKDLFYRLNVIQIKIPPLRERKDDIAPLAFNFLKKFNTKYEQDKKLTYDVIKEMEEHPWPGNIRELKNTVERMVVLRNNEYLQILDLPWYCENTPEGDLEGDRSLAKAVGDFERKILLETLRRHRSTRKAAEALKVDQATIVRKMKKYGIDSGVYAAALDG
ncbi:MAG: sigma 54-interacting transcriptional regulator [Clostridiales Family XIII bacterium]|nr:sigma 54-interacting transcriptional regulator [Clostridiales Family XIII bacterium]